jgi:hypothetical protein
LKQIPSVYLDDFLSDDISKRNDFIENIAKVYEDITAGEFLEERIRDLGLRK